MGSVFKQSKINKLVVWINLGKKRKDYTNDEKEGDQSSRCPRVHKQKKTKKVGEIISRVMQEIGKNLK